MKPIYSIKVKDQYVTVSRKAIQQLCRDAISNHRLCAYQAQFNDELGALEFVISISDGKRKDFEEVAYISFPFDVSVYFEKLENIIFP